MNNVFKPLGIAAAVAAASAGYVNVANAQTAPVVANNALGDLALVPYYTVNGEWITGIHIVNTSLETQVVKFRFRRADDSLDALDFNIVLSPSDVYAGFLSDDENGVISWSADDTTCTVPATTAGKLTMPEIYREGAETGYVEIIAMGQAPVSSPIGVASKHGSTSLTPENCEAVRSNFFANGVNGSTRGVVSNASSYQASYKRGETTVPAALNTYEDSDNALKVSYFIRDNASGIEFGDNAVHIQNFLNFPSITNQQFGWLSGDLDGFDFPNLNGGVPTASAPERDRFEALRQPGVLGVGQLNNEWTANPANGAALSWVVTMPGQYVMFDTPEFVNALEDAADGEDDDDAECKRGVCDFRDIPVTATVVPYNREELSIVAESGDLTVSPALPGEAQRTQLKKETNVITFGGNNVLGVSDVDITADLAQPYGWLRLGVESAATDLRACGWVASEDVDGATLGPRVSPTKLAALQVCDGGGDGNSALSGNVPMIGFAAWARSVAANPDASYGRIVSHSFSSSDAGL